MEFFKKKPQRAADVDDYIALRDYSTAETMLKTQLRQQPDPQVNMKLGDVLRHQGLGDAAVGEYLAASDQFLAKGFTDRARAALSRAEKIAPHRPDVASRLELMERRKRMDLVRARAVEALADSPEDVGQLAPPSQVELDLIWDQLSQCEWIHSLSNDQLVRILRGMQVKRFASGKRVVAEGGLDSALFLIADGELEARRIGKRGMVNVRTFTRGDVLGEDSLLKEASWQVSLIALTDCTLLWLERSGFEQALTGNHDPRGLIEALRQQGNDSEIDRLVKRL